MASNLKKKCVFVCAVSSCKSKSTENVDLSYHFFPPTVGIMSKSTIILAFPKKPTCWLHGRKQQKKRREIPFKGVFMSFYHRRFSISW